MHQISDYEDVLFTWPPQESHTYVVWEIVGRKQCKQFSNK